VTIKRARSLATMRRSLNMTKSAMATLRSAKIKPYRGTLVRLVR
jgi:hypothetical protein